MQRKSRLRLQPGQMISRYIARQVNSSDARLGVKWSQVQLQSGSAKYAPIRNDAIVVDPETQGVADRLADYLSRNLKRFVYV
jgi:hypothetical protein